MGLDSAPLVLSFVLGFSPPSGTLRVSGYWGPFHRTQTWRRP